MAPNPKSVQGLTVPGNPNPALGIQTPTPSTGIPSLNFNPSSTALPSDQVVKVETHFQIPGTAETPATASATPSPELEKALDEAGQRVRQNPQDAPAWINLGNLYWRLGRRDFAVQCFTEALRLNPDNQVLKAWLEQYPQAYP
jgi:tetratricopeptide (TPR) repeat protein